jgi:hypothetical protein
MFASAAIVASAGYQLSANDDDDRRGDRDDDGYSIALFGDMPYNALGKSQYPALLADINRAHVEFAVHDGDLKAGGDGPCSDSLYRGAEQLQQARATAHLVPGDNDWTDCWGRYAQTRCRISILKIASTSSASVLLDRSQPRSAHAEARPPDGRGIS